MLYGSLLLLVLVKALLKLFGAHEKVAAIEKREDEIVGFIVENHYKTLYFARRIFEQRYVFQHYSIGVIRFSLLYAKQKEFHRIFRRIGYRPIRGPNLIGFY